MAKKGKKSKEKKKYGSNEASINQVKQLPSQSDLRRAKLAKLNKVPKKGSNWGKPITLPKPIERPSCTCMKLTLESNGQYHPKKCSLHQHMIAMPFSERYVPSIINLTISNKIKSLNDNNTNGNGALSELSSKRKINVSLNEVSKRINEYAELLNNHHGDSLSNASKAEVLTRLGTLLLSVKRFEEAKTCAEIAIGLRPTFSAAYFIAGQSYFNTKQYDKAINSFRAGLQEDPDRIELKEAFRKTLLEANSSRRKLNTILSRPILNHSKSNTIVRDDLSKPEWLKMKVKWGTASSSMAKMD
jgi:tetratricopeptide (TPR) repeat protein